MLDVRFAPPTKNKTCSKRINLLQITNNVTTNESECGEIINNGTTGNFGINICDKQEMGDASCSSLSKVSHENNCLMRSISISHPFPQSLIHSLTVSLLFCYESVETDLESVVNLQSLIFCHVMILFWVIDPLMILIAIYVHVHN